MLYIILNFILLNLFSNKIYIMNNHEMNEDWKELINNIEQLLENKKYKDALLIIESELKHSFWPEKEEKILENYLTNLLFEINENKIQKNFTINEIIKGIIENNNKPEIQLFFLTQLENLPLIKYKKDIQIIFDKIQNSNYLLLIFIQILKEQEINYNFQIKEKIINPIEWEDIFNNDFIKNAFIFIENNTFKNPTLKEFAINYFKNEIIENMIFNKNKIFEINPEEESQLALDSIKNAKNLLGIK